MNIKQISTLILFASSTLMGTAHAAACSPAIAGSYAATSDVTFRGFDSDACIHTSDTNDSLTEVNDSSIVSGGIYGGGWDAQLKDDLPGSGASSISWSGITWSLNADSGTQGNWLLTIADPSPTNLPITVDFLAVLKGGSLGWVGYLFNAEQFTVAGSSTGTFNIQFVNAGNGNNGPSEPNLSHLSLYIRENTNGGGGGGGGGGTVPEPGTIALLGLGLLGMGMSRLNKKA